VVSDYRKGASHKTDIAVAGQDYTISDGAVVIASITSCTNTSNPYVMIGAGLVARKARAAFCARRAGENHSA